MSFHESFWVTIGTAAPVIALAAVVSSADVTKAAETILVSADSVDLDAGSKRDLSAARMLFWCFGTTISVVLWSQIYAMTAALLSLMHEDDHWSMTPFVLIEPLAFFLLS